MVIATPAPSRGLPVGKVLLGAAALGVVGGVVLATTQRPPPELDQQVQQAVDTVPELRLGVAPPVLPDMMAPAPLSLRGIPEYPGAEPRKLIGDRPGGDQLFLVSWFTTPDSMESVLSFYEKAFSEAKLVYTSHRFGDRRGYVSWFEHELNNDGPPEFGKGVLHMVSVSQEGLETSVFVSATEPQKLLENLEPLPAGVKLPPGGTPRVLNMSEFGEQRATILATYQLKAELLAEAVAETWKKAGWDILESSAASANEATLVAGKDQRRLTAHVRGAGAEAQLFVTVEELASSKGMDP